MTRGRGSVWRRLGASVLLAFGLGLLAGCHKNASVEFHRPPASASVPETPPEAAETEPEVKSAAVEQDTVTEEPPLPTEETQPPREPSRPAPTPPPDPEPAPPPRPELPGNQPNAEDAESIAVKLRRTTDLFAVLRSRSLTVKQHEQVEAAQAFVAQARTALDEGDVLRAAVLGDKGFLLAEDVERASR
ncbi:MAG TPA: hypothetical protein VGC53_12385 [Vicinamibacteria bacterium]